MHGFLSKTSLVFFFAALFFAFMEVVYGYFFGVWRGMFTALTTDAHVMGLTKVGETVLWAFLAIMCLLVSYVAESLARRSD